MRCPVCDHENQAGSPKCEACDESLELYDQAKAVQKYERAFEKLTSDGVLSEKGAQQCLKLREKLFISDSVHERLMEALNGSDDNQDLQVSLAISWASGNCVDVALIHKGDFTFEQVEITVLSTLNQRITRERLEDLDPDERHVFQAELYEEGKEPSSLISLGVQCQIKAVDITDEQVFYRSPLLSLSGAESELVDLEGKAALSFVELIERRALFSLLGSEGWRELALRPISEDDFFLWEVQVAATKDWLRRSSADGWRVGDQYQCDLGEIRFNERLCPGGVSWIGAPLGVGRDWETPAHQVKITGPLWCSETTVTQALWQEIMGDNPSVHRNGNYPVDSVSWQNAIQFCNRLSKRLGLSPVYHIAEDGRVSRNRAASGFRLPTEAEWEHLAKGGLDRIYAGSNRPDQVCWSIEDSEQKPHEVAEKNANAWGLFDFCGNVWEWCEDYFLEEAYRKRVGVFSDPCVEVKSQKQTSPSRVRRGGSWATNSQACRVFTRADGLETWSSQFVGFRVVRIERRGVIPADRLVSAEQASWAHLQQGPVYLACVGGSPRRAWAIRLEALGVKLTLEEAEASVVIMVLPRETRPSKLKLEKLDQIRQRVRGVGAVVLESKEAEALIEAREIEVHQIEQSEERWNELYGKSVLLVGRFSLTQKVLSKRLSSRGVLITVDPERAEVLVAGGGKLAQKRMLEFNAKGRLVLHEVECLAILEAQPTILL